jgi:hypothetical protein
VADFRSRRETGGEFDFSGGNHGLSW